MKQLKIGIIGAGRIGSLHAKSITYNVPTATVVGITDVFRANAEKVAAELNIPVIYDDYKQMLADPNVEAVLICSSTDTHADIAIEAAEAGKHTDNIQLCFGKSSAGTTDVFRHVYRKRLRWVCQPTSSEVFRSSIIWAGVIIKCSDG